MLDTHARRWVQTPISQAAALLLRWGLRPNQVTVIAFLIGLAAGLLTYAQFTVIAVILLWFSGFLDAVDGSMARQSHRSTPWGTLLDITFDRIVELGIIIALAVRFPQHQFLLLLLTAAIVFSMTIFLTVGALSEKQGVKSFYYQAGLAERTEGFILFSLMILFPGWLFWTTSLFFAVEVFTALQRMGEARRLFSE